jgi:hypothetical protein
MPSVRWLSAFAAWLADNLSNKHPKGLPLGRLHQALDGIDADAKDVCS